MAYRRADAYDDATACLTEALAESRAMNDQRHMQFLAAFWRHKSRKHVLGVVVLGSRPNQANSTKNSAGVNIDGENVKAQAVHHHAKRRLRSDARQASQFGVGIFRRETSKLAGRSRAEIGKQL